MIQARLMGRVTIEDVAERAGVSVATVDRVLNSRATVRPRNAARVEAAIRALNYQPDRLAARLARQRSYRFCFVLPRGGNIFMRDLATEIESHARHLAGERVSADILYTDIFDPEALSASLLSVSGKYDGVALVALDHPRVREAIQHIASHGAEVVTLVSDAPGAARSHFVGIENAAAGRTAATLLGRYLGGRRGKIGIIAGSLALRDHAERHFGFAQVIAAEYRDLSLLPVQEGRDNPERSMELAAGMIAREGDLVGIYNIGAGTEGIIEALQSSGRSRDIVFVAHELNEITRHALLDGAVDVVIAQDPGHEARSAMRVLMARCDKAAIIAAQERISVDIFVKDNLP
ncbi:MAG: LacI family DNA-binding transcriptional regulator [Proteobacteria bacterium]|nr:LacI family DNA-binding transcriptional regulator [Pseudomonadota bacterium]